MKIIGIAGWVVGFGSGLWMWVWYIGVIDHWLVGLFGGIVGSILAFFVAISTAPGVFVFPVVFRLIEGYWLPNLYYILITVTVLAPIIGSICMSFADSDDA